MWVNLIVSKAYEPRTKLKNQRAKGITELPPRQYHIYDAGRKGWDAKSRPVSKLCIQYSPARY